MTYGVVEGGGKVSTVSYSGLSALKIGFPKKSYSVSSSGISLS